MSVVNIIRLTSTSRRRRICSVVARTESNEAAKSYLEDEATRGDTHRSFYALAAAGEEYLLVTCSATGAVTRAVKVKLSEPRTVVCEEVS